VTEGVTLLPGIGVDKRTKEVFAVSLERMTGAIVGAGKILTVARPATVHVRNRSFSVVGPGLFWAGFHRTLICSSLI